MRISFSATSAMLRRWLRMESLYTCFALRYGDEDVFQTCALDAQRGKGEVLLISDRERVFGQRIGIISIKAPLIALPFRSDHEAAPFYCVYVDAIVLSFRELELLEELIGASVSGVPGHAVKPSRQNDILFGGQIGIYVAHLGDDTHLHLCSDRTLLQVDPSNRDLPGVRREQAREHPDRRCLTGPVWAEKSENLTVRNAKRDVVHSGDSAESFYQSVNSDHFVPFLFHFTS